MSTTARPRGNTVLEALFPGTPEALTKLAVRWVASSSEHIIDSLWRAYATMSRTPDQVQALARATDDVERGCTQLLYFHLDDLMTGFEPFRLLHGVPEGASRKPAPARPPEYDIGFVMRSNYRIVWPVEAKVLRSPGLVSDYVKTIRTRMLSGLYGPFVTEGAMVGYLLSGTAAEVFSAIEKSLRVRLVRPRRWRGKEHATSHHKRRLKRRAAATSAFLVHHLIFAFIHCPVVDPASISLRTGMPKKTRSRVAVAEAGTLGPGSRRGRPRR
jgi:hypothetical protein